MGITPENARILRLCIVLIINSLCVLDGFCILFILLKHSKTMFFGV